MIFSFVLASASMDRILILSSRIPCSVFQLNLSELLFPEGVSHAVVPGQPSVGLDVGVPYGHDLLDSGVVSVLEGDGLNDHPD